MFYNLKNWKLKDKSLIDAEIWENVIQAKVNLLNHFRLNAQKRKCDFLNFVGN